MGVADRDRQSICGIGPADRHARKLHLHHMVDLGLVGMADADHRLFDRIGGVFADRQPGLRRDQQRDAARLTQLQRATASLLTKVCSTAA